MRYPITVMTLIGVVAVSAQQPPNPRQQPGASITLFAPDQHDLYDGHFVLSANRIHMVGTLNDAPGWDHMDNNATTVNKKGAAGEVNPATQQIDFYIRSPQQNPKNKPNREVFLHFFGLELTWK